MDSWTAFFCGLILGSDFKKNNKHHHSAPRPRNIALQDVAFCQALRNIIDRTDDYIKTISPTPEKFIERFYPQSQSAEISTSNDKSLKNRTKLINDYLLWVESIGTDKWYSLSTLEKIWQSSDFSHIPDVENLDLLFSLEDNAKPLSFNGRIYEYEPIEKHTAKGFFNNTLARTVYERCYETSKFILEQSGFEYDYARFEYNKTIDLNNRITPTEREQKIKEWQIDSRQQEYLLLLKNNPSFVLNPWSEMTRNLKACAKNDEEYKKIKIDRTENKRRNSEIKKIYKCLSPEQREKFLKLTPKMLTRSDNIIGSLLVLLVLGFIICLIITSAIPELNTKELSSVIIIVFSTVFIVLCFSTQFGIDEIEKIWYYIKIRQMAYYLNDDNLGYKTEYEALLKQSKTGKS